MVFVVVVVVVLLLFLLLVLWSFLFMVCYFSKLALKSADCWTMTQAGGHEVGDGMCVMDQRLNNNQCGMRFYVAVDS